MTSIDGPLFLETAAKHGVPASVVRELTARTRPRLSLVRHGELPEPSRENARPAARTGGLPALPRRGQLAGSTRAVGAERRLRGPAAGRPGHRTARRRAPVVLHRGRIPAGAVGVAAHTRRSTHHRTPRRRHQGLRATHPVSRARPLLRRRVGRRPADQGASAVAPVSACSSADSPTPGTWRGHGRRSPPGSTAGSCTSSSTDRSPSRSVAGPRPGPPRSTVFLPGSSLPPMNLAAPFHLYDM